MAAIENNRIRPEEKGILENRMIRVLKVFQGDKTYYRDREEKFVNACAQIRKGSRQAFEWIKSRVDEGAKDFIYMKDRWDVEEWSNTLHYEMFGEGLLCV